MIQDDTNYFFKNSDYAAFARSRWEDESPEAVEGRVKVRNKLARLNQRLITRLREHGLNLHPHYDDTFLTSRVAHKADGSPFNSPSIKEIWLHYGRDKRQSKALKGRVQLGHESPVYQMRIQVTVGESGIGIWLRVGMPGGGAWEKEKLRTGWRTDPELKAALYEQFRNLNGDYELYLDDNDCCQIEITDMESMTDLLKRVRDYKYCLICTNIRADDDRLVDDKIVDTLYKEIERLYPIYQSILYVP